MLMLLLSATMTLLSFKNARADIAVPALSSPVIDEADFFNNQEEALLITKIKRLYAAGGPQMQIWTFPSLEGEPIESLSIRAVETWKLGRSGQDDGVLLSIARNERRFRLEVGRGLEGVIPDVLAARLLRQYLAPALRRSAASAGVELIIREMARMTISQSEERAFEKLQSETSQEKSASGFLSSLFKLIFFILLLFVIIISRIMSGPFGRRRGIFIGTSSGRSWGGWSGGGWSGGGGGFSGGGSSGGW
jgi:uncharacterized protein